MWPLYNDSRHARRIHGVFWHAGITNFIRHRSRALCFCQYTPSLLMSVWELQEKKINTVRVWEIMSGSDRRSAGDDTQRGVEVDRTGSGE